MKDEKARDYDGESVGWGDGAMWRRGDDVKLRGADVRRLITSPRLPLTPSPRPLVSPSVLHPSAFILHPCVVALTVKKAEVLFAEFGVGDLDLELVEAAVP